MPFNLLKTDVDVNYTLNVCSRPTEKKVRADKKSEWFSDIYRNNCSSV